MKKIFLILGFIIFSSFVTSKITYALTCERIGTCKPVCGPDEIKLTHNSDCPLTGNSNCCAPRDAGTGGSGCTTPEGTAGLPTAIGCIDTAHPDNFIKQILGFAVGIGGGIAFILMLFGSFQIMASGGDPKGIQGGKETITSALTGLLLIVFSVFLLKLIGVDILGIPGLSSTP